MDLSRSSMEPTSAERREAIRSTFGTKQTSLPTLSMSALRGKADIPDPMSVRMLLTH
jgi:hypothetical protein